MKIMHNFYNLIFIYLCKFMLYLLEFAENYSNALI